MSSEQSRYLRFGGAIALIVISLVYLAYTGVRDSKSYYVTIGELQSQSTQGDGIYKKHLRVAGNVLPGSIKRQGTRVEFVLDEQGKKLPVIYQGTEAPPDTYKDDAQALAEGQLGRDGIFHAKNLQAKCASKYAPKKAALSQPQATRG